MWLTLIASSRCQLDVDDRSLLLKSCCMEIMCLRAASRYDSTDKSLTLSNGCKFYKHQLESVGQHSIAMLMVPIFEFAQSITRMELDHTEVALLAGLLLMQGGEVPHRTNVNPSCL